MFAKYRLGCDLEKEKVYGNKKRIFEIYYRTAVRT